jgi:hypothetical protein
MTALNIPTFNSNASWLKDKVEPIFENEAVLTDLETEIGRPLKEIEKDVHTVMNIYLDTLQDIYNWKETKKVYFH